MDTAELLDAQRRIQVDFLEWPTLKLTFVQARRLWNLPSDLCERARKRHEPRQAVRHLDARELRAALMADDDGEVAAAVRDEREGWPGSNARGVSSGKISRRKYFVRYPRTESVYSSGSRNRIPWCSSAGRSDSRQQAA